MGKQLQFDFMDEMPIKENKNLGRKLTIKLVITDPTKAEKWLWNTSENSELGIHISGLSNGDMFKREDILESTLNLISDKFGDEEGIIEDAFSKIEKLY